MFKVSQIEWIMKTGIILEYPQVDIIPIVCSYVAIRSFLWLLLEA
jgi:hypothetical protein